MSQPPTQGQTHSTPPAGRASLSTECILWLATGGFLGYSPVAPGTMGAIWGIPLAWGLRHLNSPPLEALAIVALCAAGIPLCTAAARAMGGAKDPGSITWDEIASLPMTYFLHDLSSPWVLVAGFVLHRVFDILKPPPAKALERLPAGLGIMADDWIAGLYSNLALWPVSWLLAWMAAA